MNRKIIVGFLFGVLFAMLVPTREAHATVYGDVHWMAESLARIASAMERNCK